MPEVETPDRVGSVIDGRYKIVEVMASGSMGSVYKAERIPVGKLVAVKFLHAGFANDSEFQARFERETRVMSKLNHPNCVSVLDFGVFEGAPYLVMDFVAGTTLRARMDKEGPLPPLMALAIARQMLAGLAHAHQQEVFHRDVKPANIMISEEIGHGERVRILDFGLARLQGNVGRDATQTNMVVGTPNYMAPEQTVPGANVDARTDLYAVGVVLYEMVAGERPFQAEDTLQLLGMHRAAPIPRLADRVKPGVELPVGLQDLVDKAMAKSPDARYQTAIEFAAAIDEVIAGKLDVTQLDVTLPKTETVTGRKKLKTGKASTVGLASTVLDMERSAIEREAPPRQSHFVRNLFFAMLLVGGTAAAAGYWMKQRDERAARAPVGTATDDSSGSAAVAVEPADAAVALADPLDAGLTTDAGATDVAAVLDDAGVLDADAGAAEVAVVDDSGIDEEEIEIEPDKAENPDETAATTPPPEDEEEDAPKTAEEAEKVEEREPKPSPPQLARTVREAVLMIKAGKKSLALTSLRALWKKQPNSGYIPFLLGNLYFEKKWWSVAMDHYRAAIKKHQGYRKNGELNRNVIRMLASTKTRQKATNFIRGVIGRYSKPYLRWAAKNEKSATVRKQAAVLARYIR